MEEVPAGSRDISLTIKCLKYRVAVNLCSANLVSAYNVPRGVWDAGSNKNMASKDSFLQGAHS